MKIAYALIVAALQTTQDQVQVGEQYYHYKNPAVIYEVLSLSVDIDNEERILVNYKKLGDADNVVWSRSITDFFSTVQVEGKEIPKFVKNSSRNCSGCKTSCKEKTSDATRG